MSLLSSSDPSDVSGGRSVQAKGSRGWGLLLRQVVDATVFIDQELGFTVPLHNGDNWLAIIRDQYLADGVAKAVVNRLFHHNLLLHCGHGVALHVIPRPFCIFWLQAGYQRWYIV